MNTIAYLLTVLLFLGPVILSILGWPVEGDMVGTVKMYPAVYITTISLLFYNKWWINRKEYKYEIGIVIVTILAAIIGKLSTGNYSQMILFNSMALPALYSLFFLQLGERGKKNVFYVLIFMFIINCTIAIVERIQMQLYWPTDLIWTHSTAMNSAMEMASFRSTALLGFPLSNALMTSTIMGFILVSNLRSLHKYSLFALGFLSLLCFNARAAILLCFISLFFYISIDSPKGKKVSNYIFAVIIICSSLILLNNGFGSRFADTNDVSEDSSIQARFEVLDFIMSYDFSQFLWGMSADKATFMMYSLTKNVHIENWFIMSMMITGLVVTSTVLLLFIPIFKRCLLKYSRSSCLVVLFLSVVLSLTNNSLACGVQDIALFIVCCYVFPYYDKNERKVIQL